MCTFTHLYNYTPVQLHISSITHLYIYTPGAHLHSSLLQVQKYDMPASAAPQPAAAAASPLPTAPLQLPSPQPAPSPLPQPALSSPVRPQQQPTIIRVSSPAGMPQQGGIALPAGVRPGANIVRVRAPSAGQVGGATLPSGQQIKVVGAGGQTHIIKSQAGGMSGIAALAAAAAQQGKMVTTMAGGQIMTTMAGAQQQGGAIKLVQGPGGQGQILQQGMKMVQQSGGQTAMIGGQTVRLASPGGTLLKPGTAITGPGGKQIILQKQGPGGGQPQIVTLVKTSQGMQVATMPKGAQGQVGVNRHNTISDSFNIYLGGGELQTKVICQRETQWESSIYFASRQLGQEVSSS